MQLHTALWLSTNQKIKQNKEAPWLSSQLQNEIYNQEAQMANIPYNIYIIKLSKGVPGHK